MAPFILLCNWALSWEHLFIAALLQWLHYLPHSSPFWAGKENIGLPCHPSYYYLQIIPYFSMTPKTQRKHVAWLHDRAVGSHCRLLAPGWLQSSMLSQPLTLLLSIFWGISASKVDPRRLTSFHQPVCPCTDLVFHHLSCQSCNPYFTKNCCFPLLVSNCCLLPFSSFFPVPDSKNFWLHQCLYYRNPTMFSPSITFFIMSFTVFLAWIPCLTPSILLILLSLTYLPDKSLTQILSNVKLEIK